MGEVRITRPGEDEDLVLEVDEIHEMTADLASAGWVRVGPLWKQPGDHGPTGRKWTTGNAHRQLALQQIAQREAEQAAAAKKARSRRRKS